MEEIFEQEKEYLFVLKALNELPFPVGRKLLGDFLMGDMTNKSILKNNLYDFFNAKPKVLKRRDNINQAAPYFFFIGYAKRFSVGVICVERVFSRKGVSFYT